MIRAKTIYNAYPYSEELSVTPPEADEPFDVWFQRIRSELPECGDGLFRYLLTELFEGGEVADDTFTTDPDDFIQLIERCREDLQKVIDALRAI